MNDVKPQIVRLGKEESLEAGLQPCRKLRVTHMKN